MAADAVHIQVRYSTQTLACGTILECLSSLGQDAEAVIHSLDGYTSDLDDTLLSHHRGNHSPIVCWKDQIMSYDDIAALGKRQLVLDFIGHRVLTLEFFTCLCGTSLTLLGIIAAVVVNWLRRYLFI
jgi:hypothetical protein